MLQAAHSLYLQLTISCQPSRNYTASSSQVEEMDHTDNSHGSRRMLAMSITTVLTVLAAPWRTAACRFSGRLLQILWCFSLSTTPRLMLQALSGVFVSIISVWTRLQHGAGSSRRPSQEFCIVSTVAATMRNSSSITSLALGTTPACHPKVGTQ